MSVSVLSLIWNCEAINDHAQLLVMLALADFSSDTGESKAGIKRISKKARMSDRTCQRVMAKLEESGFLKIRRGEGMRTKNGSTNLYQIVLKRCQDVKEKEALRRVIASGRRVIELAQGYNTEFSEIRDEIEKVVKLKARHGIRVALVDYLQRCRPSVTRRDGARYLEVAEVSDRLKSLALELNLIMIAPSQLNDRGEVREARSIEHDCDVHLQIVSDEKGSEDDVFLCVEKHRQGRRRMRIPLRFNGEYMTLEERETRAAARNPYTDEDYR
jgi:DNA-binding transcriptional regulator YhcF (GntR family)